MSLIHKDYQSSSTFFHLEQRAATTAYISTNLQKSDMKSVYVCLDPDVTLSTFQRHVFYKYEYLVWI